MTTSSGSGSNKELESGPSEEASHRTTRALGSTTERVSEKILDSALLLALGSGLLYFMGLSANSGLASGHNLPSALLRLETWEVFADGAAALLLLPITLLPFPKGFVVVLLGIGLGLFFRSAIKNKAIAVVAISAVVVFTLFATIFFQYRSLSADIRKAAHECLAGGECREDLKLSEVRTGEGRKDTQRGILISLKSDFLFLQTKEGVLLIPKSLVRSIRIVDRK